MALFEQFLNASVRLFTTNVLVAESHALMVGRVKSWKFCNGVLHMYGTVLHSACC